MKFVVYYNESKIVSVVTLKGLFVPLVSRFCSLTSRKGISFNHE